MLVKFAPTKILSNLQENKKNCLVVVGKEPIQISAVKDDINKSCQNDSIQNDSISSSLFLFFSFISLLVAK